MSFDIHRLCDVCDCPQFPSPSGWVCRNGHGEAPFHLGEVEDYERQYRQWFGEILEDIRSSHRE